MTDIADTEAQAPPAKSRPRREAIYRHTRVVRITHWINAICLFFLLASGMQIFNAHPALYWGQEGFTYDKRAVLQMKAEPLHGTLRGVTTIGGVKFDTTGVFGYSRHWGQ